MSHEFAAGLSAEDLEDIAAGDIPLGTVQAFEQAAIAREAEDLREAFDQRAGILEFDAGLPRAEAELEGADHGDPSPEPGLSVGQPTGGRGGLPGPAGSGARQSSPVDALPLGLPALAVQKDKRVLRQGTFTGAHGVKA